VVQGLFKENGAAGLDASAVNIWGEGVEAAPGGNEQSPETYVGYCQAERFSSPGRFGRDSLRTCRVPAKPGSNQWGLAGSWTAGAKSAVLAAAPGKIVFRLRRRDVRVVPGPTKGGKPVRLRVKLNGALPGENYSVDSCPDGSGNVRVPRLYRLKRQKGRVQDVMFEIEFFLDSGVQALAFTCGSR
jgi:Thioredoxin like C-terminal domain